MSLTPNWYKKGEPEKMLEIAIAYGLDREIKHLGKHSCTCCLDWTPVSAHYKNSNDSEKLFSCAAPHPNLVLTGEDQSLISPR